MTAARTFFGLALVSFHQMYLFKFFAATECFESATIEDIVEGNVYHIVGSCVFIFSCSDECQHYFGVEGVPGESF